MVVVVTQQAALDDAHSAGCNFEDFDVRRKVVFFCVEAQFSRFHSVTSMVSSSPFGRERRGIGVEPSLYPPNDVCVCVCVVECFCFRLCVVDGREGGW